MSVFIKKIKNKKVIDLSYQIIAADFETLTFKERFYVAYIGIYYRDLSERETFKYFSLRERKEIQDEDLDKDSRELVENFIAYLILNFKNPKIYFHNLGRFDGIFLLDFFNKYSSLEEKKFNLVFRNNRIYNISYKNITFFDSYLILSSSLDKLSEIFLQEKKEKIDYNVFQDVEKIFKQKKEILSYLNKDVEILYKIIIKIYKRFSQEFNINIFKNYTLPSISFMVFRQEYLKNYKIYISKGYNYDFLKLSYHGGLNSVVQPHMKQEGFVFDVNSLYPFVMMHKEMPLGTPEWFYNSEGFSLETFFGFVECEVYVPEFLSIPPLCIKVDGVLVQKVGDITGVFFSEELKNSLKYGCVVKKVFRGIKFNDKAVIFKDYIEHFYYKRINSENLVDNYIYKMMMNSLYGRFGLNNEIDRTKFVSDEDIWLYEFLFKIEKKINNNIINYKVDKNYLDNFEKSLDTSKFSNQEKKMFYNEIEKIRFKQENIVTAIQIAAAISSYARIYMINTMNEHITKNNAKIYYYDTDSIHTNKKLPEKMISNNVIGLFKLEHVVDEAVYLSPKIYCLKKKSGEVIKFKGLIKTHDDLKTFDDFKDKLKKNSFFEFNSIKIMNINWNTYNLNNKKTVFKTQFDSNKYDKVYDEMGFWISNKWKK